MIDQATNLVANYIRSTFPVPGIGRIPLSVFSGLGLNGLATLKRYFSNIFNNSGLAGNASIFGPQITANYGDALGGLGVGPGSTSVKGPTTRNPAYTYQNADRHQIKIASDKINSCEVLFDAEVPVPAVISLKKIISLNLNKFCYLIPAIFVMRSIRYLLYDLHKKYDLDIRKLKIISIPCNKFYPNYLIISDDKLDLELFENLKGDAEKAHKRQLDFLSGEENYFLFINLNRFYELDILHDTFNYDLPKNNFVVINGYVHADIEKVKNLGLKTKNILGQLYFIKEIKHNDLVLENVLSFFKQLSDIITNKVLTFDEFIIRNSVFKESNLEDNINLMLHSVDYSSRKKKLLMLLDADSLLLSPKNFIINDKLFMIDDEITPVVLIVSDKMKLLHPRISNLIRKKKLLFKSEETRAYIL